MALQRSALAALVVFGCSSPVVPGEFDYDNDGFVTSRDCDDMNSAIFPGADEFCDGVDSDCDGVIDNDPVDGLIAFVDADGDGVGVAETLQRVCELDAGLSQTTGDCNDNDATIFPGSPEICDLIDNDCDGKADLNRVPTDYATIEQAMDALPTNSEICLQSSLTEAQTAISVTGSYVVTGPEGGAIPQLELPVALESALFDIEIGAELTLRRISFRGPKSSSLSSSRLADIDRGHLELSNIEMADFTLRTEDDGSFGIDGGLVRCSNGSVTSTDVTVQGLTFEVQDGPLQFEANLRGGWLSADSCDILVEGLRVSESSLTSDPRPHHVAIAGGVIFAEDSSVTLRRIEIQNYNARFSPDTIGLFSGVVSLYGGECIVDRLVMDGISVTQNRGTALYFGTTLTTGEARGSLNQIELRNSTLDLEKADSSVALGIAYLSGDTSLEVSALTATNNRAIGDVISGGVLHLLGFRDARWIDLRNNYVRGNQISGGAAYVSSATFSADAPTGSSVRNLIVAGNRADGGIDGTAVGAGLYIEVGSAPFLVENADFVGNRIVGRTDDSKGAGIFANKACCLSNYQFRNLSFYQNELDPLGPSAGTAIGASFDEVVYPVHDVVNVFNTTDVDPFSGLPPFEYTTHDPRYVDIQGNDPNKWDLRLQADSPLRDAGAEDVLDADGTRSDIGAYGGPGSAGW